MSEISKAQQTVKTYLTKCLSLSHKAHDCLFQASDLEFEDNKALAQIKRESSLAYLSQAYTCAQLSNYAYLQVIEEHGEWQEFESVFHKFEVFNKEFLSSYSISHSPQWTDIEFNSFKELCEDFLLNLSSI